MKFRVLQPGIVPYCEAWEMQKVLVEERRAGKIPDTLLLLEHPPTITLGRGADRAHVLASADELAERGIERVDTDRGGDVTYHGPGQLVGYPILDLREAPHRPDLHEYFRRLEETLIHALSMFGIAGDRFSKYTGVWIVPPAAPPEKIAAMGIRISRWITCHGFALNVCPRLDHFASIVPCGIHDYGVTSMSRVLDRSVSVSEVTPAVIASFATVFGMECECNGDQMTVAAASI